MALEDAATADAAASSPKPLPQFHHYHPKSKTPHDFPPSTTSSSTNPPPSSNHARSTQNYSSRRYSLPLHFLPSALWSANTSTASLVVESDEAARGEHILDEATVAHRISALRQLNGATRSGHRYAKSTGARNSTFSQPVIVRTYSGSRPHSQQKSITAPRRENERLAMSTPKMDLKLPPIEAFSFKGIMDDIRNGVSDDLERIAEICARSKYSLSNQYEVHMPPHGRGEAFLPAGNGSGPNANGGGGGPTLQAVGSDDDHSRSVGRSSRGGRRTKSVAYGTLETIMSSSRSSDEDKSKKKAAAVIAEEVRGRAAKKELLAEILHQPVPDPPIEAGPSGERPSKHSRSKSATFASVIIDNAQGPKNESAAPLASATSLISEPARPQTSMSIDLRSAPSFSDPGSPKPSSIHKRMSTGPNSIKNESWAATLRRGAVSKPSILGNLSSWLPWSKTQPSGFQGRQRSGSHAEGSLRDLLKSTETDKKGKGVDRTG
ncbi:hypothetical protein HYALB_00004265 [Hymenoscyphus albidus]|uniref:Uncharacterized protein n=1 Tax=Hymenoscyphus albidus TaxID=595503 RepID=A0A9N9LMU3_9HELO|nr:hypothetical protein HYALB_00004265 [Hymenoscyphus albidus]